MYRQKSIGKNADKVMAKLRAAHPQAARQIEIGADGEIRVLVAD